MNEKPAFSAGEKCLFTDGFGKTEPFDILEVRGVNPKTGRYWYVGRDLAGEEWALDESFMARA